MGNQINNLNGLNGGAGKGIIRLSGVHNGILIRIRRCLPPPVVVRLVVQRTAMRKKYVSGSIIDFQGFKVLKIEQDLKELSFNIANLEATVDEPAYAQQLNLDFENTRGKLGTIGSIPPSQSW